jgi:hypothetical protein
MTLIAPHIAAFLQQRLPIERQASPNTCDSYASHPAGNNDVQNHSGALSMHPLVPVLQDSVSSVRGKWRDHAPEPK